MNRFATFKLAPVALLAAAAWAPQTHAATQTVELNALNASVTLATPFNNNDSLVLDTLVATPGALNQTINFSLASSVSGLLGQAVWEIGTATGTGPRLIGVNIDIFNNTTNALVVSDSFQGTLGGFAISTFLNTPIGPGTYRLVATGTGVRESSLNVTVSFVPEPGTYLLMLAGLAGVGFVARRRRSPH